MKWRLAITTAFALLLGAWCYLDEWSYERPGSLPDTLNDPLVASALMLLAILTGFLVARPWVLLSLVAPIASLAYLQSTGEKGPDGISPLTSPPGIAHIVWFALLLAVGLGLSSLWRQFEDRRKPAKS
ncbi:MAG: hypothetical protein QOF13_1135 [Solirubrobacterales bacterium]|jgi:hypothetical protein|nr:hypothetical protein [Solirubrobacterales bacterium]